MKRAPLVLFIAALLVAVAWPVSKAIGAASGLREPGICRHMTPARMLENPALAQEWAAAVRSAAPDEIARVRAMFDEIRAAHGCTGAIAMPAPAGEPGGLPPGHPPVGERALPEGHPPIPSAPSAPRTPVFEPPAFVTI
jgi:hypothetical protein